jgi:DNA (cytosine-5)-methyltransferase 1
VNVLSLFTGIGGLDLGLERAGMRIVGQVEIDPFCRSVLERHWPRVPRHEDVRTCVKWWSHAERPRVDVLVAGFPCQPFSIAGPKLGRDDDRWLWPHTARVVRALRPPWVLLENVPGLLRQGFGDVLGDLAAIGYDAEWESLPASAFGAPHRRDRVYAVAYPYREHSGPEGGPSRGRQLWTDLPSRVQETLADTKGNGRGARRTRGPAIGSASRPHVTAQRVADAHRETGNVARRTGCAVFGPATEQRPGRRSGRSGERGISDAHREPSLWTPVPRKERHHWTTEPKVGRVAHGIPSRVDRLRALGNAVVPQVAEYVGRCIIAAERRRRRG